MQKELLAELVIVQKNAHWEQCTILRNNEQCMEWCCTIGVYYDNVLQGAKSNTVGTRYYSTLGATSTLIICDSRGLSAGDDAYEERDDQDGVLVMNIMSQETNFG